jgi:ribosome maturation factor RimP
MASVERERGSLLSLPPSAGVPIVESASKCLLFRDFHFLRVASLSPSWSARCLSVAAAGTTSQSQTGRHEEDDEGEEGIITEIEQEEEEASGKRFFKLKELEIPGTILVGTNAVGTQVYEAAEKAISQLMEDQGVNLAIFSFGFEASQGKAYLRLDKLDNKYGSPTLDEIDMVSRKYGEVLAQELGEAVADDIEVEVSSPGAERQLVIPQDLTRFGDLALCVELPKDSFELEGVEVKKSKNDMHTTIKVVMEVRDVSSEREEVELAPVKSKVNENTFGRKTWNKILKSKKTLTIGYQQVTRVNIHLEI